MTEFELDRLFDIIKTIEKHNDDDNLTWGLTLSYRPDGWHCELFINNNWRRRAYLKDAPAVLHLKKRIMEHREWEN